jgi:hypothetical protein
VLRGLSSSFRLLAITIDVLFSCAIDTKGTELHSGPIHFSIARHTNSLLLIKNPTLITWSPSRTTSCSQSWSRMNTCRWALLLLLLKG